MDAEVVLVVGGSVVLLTELIKFSGAVPDRWGLLVAMLVSAIGVGLWALQAGELALSYFDLFVSWVAVTASAAGVFGFVRAARPEGVTATQRGEDR